MPSLFSKHASPIAPLSTYSVYLINSNGTVEGRSLLSAILALYSVTDSPLLEGQNSAYHLSRTNHTSTQESTTIAVTPAIKTTGAYSIVSGDKGKVIEIDSTLTIPTGLGAGFYCNIFLNNATAKTITTTGLTLRGTPNTDISPYGLVSIYAISADTFYLKGELE